MGFFQKQLCEWSTNHLSLKGQSEPLFVDSFKFCFSKDNSFEYYEHINGLISFWWVVTNPSNVTKKSMVCPSCNLVFYL